MSGENYTAGKTGVLCHWYWLFYTGVSRTERAAFITLESDSLLSEYLNIAILRASKNFAFAKQV
jgi:hypothetical protein